MTDDVKLLPCPLDDIQILGPSTIGGDPWFGFPQTHGTDNRECPWKDDSGAARLILWFRTWNEATAFSEALRNTRVPAPREDGWRPIESAPKDGTEILLGVFRDDFEDVTIMNSCWIEAEERSRWADWHGLPYPTHWRPLPAPPSAREESDDV